MTARERLDGFRAGLAASGGTACDVVAGAFPRDDGYASALDLVRIWSGAIPALRERAVGVPDEPSVAGFDEIATLQDTIPALTTVRLPLEEMDEQAARLALAPDPPEGEAVRVPVSGEVILRETTRRLG